MKTKGFAGALSACIAAAPAIADEVKVAHYTVQAAHFAPVDEFVAEQIAAQTDGELTMRIFWGGALGGASEIVDLIRDGAIQIGVTAPAYAPTRLPLAGLTNNVPFLFKDGVQAMKVQWELSRNSAELQREYQAAGVFPMVQHGLPETQMQCTKKVETIEDLKGLKLRTVGPYWPALAEALGMVPVTMQIGELYEGLQRGVVDCAANAQLVARALKLNEVAPYWSDINLGAISGPAMYTSWSNYKDGGWPEATVTAMEGISAQALEKEATILTETKDLPAGAEIVQFKDQAKVDAAIPDMLDLWSKVTKESGVDAEAVDRFVTDFRAATDS